MFKRWRTHTPILYCIGAEIFVMAAMWASNYVLDAIVWLGLFRRWYDMEYFFMLVQELCGTAAVLVLLRGTGRLSLLRRRGCGFCRGMLVGMVTFVYSSYVLMGTALLRDKEQTLFSADRCLLFLAAVAMVGFVEEVIFRGVIAQTLLEHYGTSRRGIWRAVLLSGVLFGAAHLINLLGSDPVGVLVQCISSMVFGMLLAAIYFRTGNLWVPIFLHSYLDFVGLMEGGLYTGQGLSETISSYSMINLLPCLLYGIPAVLLLRGEKLREVELYMTPTFQDDAPAREKPTDAEP